MREDRAKHGEKRRQTERTYRRRRSDRYSAATVARTYNLTVEQVVAIHAAAECDICGRDNGKKRMAIDHCHATGVVRGALCDRCNLALGHIGDDAGRARRLAEYLDRGGFGRFRTP